MGHSAQGNFMRSENRGDMVPATVIVSPPSPLTPAVTSGARAGFRPAKGHVPLRGAAARKRFIWVGPSIILPLQTRQSPRGVCQASVIAVYGRGLLPPGFEPVKIEADFAPDGPLRYQPPVPSRALEERPEPPFTFALRQRTRLKREQGLVWRGLQESASASPRGLIR